MFEERTAPLLPARRFRRRIVSHGRYVAPLVLASLALGIFGFHAFAHQSWLDAFLNAAMLLGGMGPVGAIDPPAGKLFAGLYALYAGLVFLAVAAVLIAPFVHRALHALHLEEQKESEK